MLVSELAYSSCRWSPYFSNRSVVFQQTIVLYPRIYNSSRLALYSRSNWEGTSPSFHLRCKWIQFLKCWNTMHNVQELSNSKCSTPLSEPVTNCFYYRFIKIMIWQNNTNVFIYTSVSQLPGHGPLPGPRLMEKRIYQAMVWQRLRPTDIYTA
jgi:hypothetical protein